ncbi:MAG: hypothetical protein COA71_11885 [SAR86 cluster bacterium]|uniref:Uncharacterized protein n=1 Tax=SAR86 cluster bacterium TaxID=2030880 RepID=A0A2A5C9P0_9GAMM|nr:MAG: hypothetical protein COA71_11885 [SAR86 cluster bacterium]
MMGDLILLIEKQLENVQSNDGYFYITDEALENLSNSEYLGWTHFYKDNACTLHPILKALTSPSSSEIIEKATLQNCEQIMSQLVNIEDGFENAYSSSITLSSTKFAESTTIPLPPEFCAFAMFFNFLGLFQFGKLLTVLIQEAENADEDSFFKAIQIDKSLIVDHSFFRKRIYHAQLQMDKDFLNRLALAIKGKALSKKRKYKTINIVFYYFHLLKLLDLPHEELLDACIKIGVTDSPDINGFSKKLRAFKSSIGTQFQFSLPST